MGDWGGYPLPPLQKMFLADFWGTPTLRGKTHQTVFDPFPVWMFFYSPGVWERWKIADAPKKSERVVWEWYWYEAHSERVVTNHRLESDIGVMEKGCGCYYTSYAKIFCTMCYIFCTICYVPCTVSCVKEKGPHSPQGLWADNVGCGLGLGFPVREEPGIWFHLVSPRAQILQNQEKMQHRKG